jgi:uncharacterized protein (DUF488 family)
MVFTIGHSAHSIEKVVHLLVMHSVTAVADVRSQPYSRFNPQFNRENLRASLKHSGLSYVFLGRELGARTNDRSCYRSGAVQYDLLSQTSLFQEGLKRVAEGVAKNRIALMCAEKDPLTCHRAILICRHLESHGIGAQHILGDGRIETHEAALSRLLLELDLGGDDLFRTRDELIGEAYERRGREIAYSEKEPIAEEQVREGGR